MDLIESFCGEIRHLLQSTDNQAEIFSRGREIVSRMALKTVFLKEILSRYATDDEFLMSRLLTVDPNEVTIFVDPSRLFSLRLYIWDPAVTYPIHAHGAWGVVSCVAGAIIERKYERIDGGERPGHAEIRELGRGTLRPGETTVVLPLDQGIHGMESASQDSPSISLHLYGRAVRRGYLECFDLHKKTVYKVIPPYLYGRACVLKALGAVKENWASDILEKAALDKKAYLRYEALRSLAHLDEEKALPYIEEEMKRETPLKDELVFLYNTMKLKSK